MRTLLLAASSLALAPLAGAQSTVIVTVDMDAEAPGIQSSVALRAGDALLSNVAVYVFDPSGTHSVFAIGYLGGIDRGIAFGHAPTNANAGELVALHPTPGTPVNPANTPWPFSEPFLDKGFGGLEVQYVEAGADTAAPIPAQPDAPIFTVDLEFARAAACDVYDFHLLDFTVVWSAGQGGAFSTSGINSLDAGGDAVPDLTRTAYGLDPDAALPAPPAPFLVDYRDGPNAGGPATVVVTRAGDLDHDLDVDLEDLSTLLSAFGTTHGAAWAQGDADGDGDVDLADLSTLLAQFGWSCGE